MKRIKSTGSRRIGATIALFLLATCARADVVDFRAANVTPVSAALAWVSDSAIDGVTVSVFADPDGLIDVSGSVTIEVMTDASPGSHASGLAVVRVSGLAAGTQYFVRTQTDAISGAIEYPPAPALFALTTAQAVTLEDLVVTAQPIANPILRHSVIDPLSAAALEGALVFADRPGISPYPVLAIARETTAIPSTPEAALDLNNMFDSLGGNGIVPGGAPALLTEWRGLACASAQNQARSWFARAPLDNASPGVRRAQGATACYASDAVCDDRLDVLDFQFVLTAQGAQSNDCRYSFGLDVAPDGIVDDADYAEIINRLGDTAPF